MCSFPSLLTYEVFYFRHFQNRYKKQINWFLIIIIKHFLNILYNAIRILRMRHNRSN